MIAQEVKGGWSLSGCSGCKTGPTHEKDTLTLQDPLTHTVYETQTI